MGFEKAREVPKGNVADRDAGLWKDKVVLGVCVSIVGLADLAMVDRSDHVPVWTSGVILGIGICMIAVGKFQHWWHQK